MMEVAVVATHSVAECSVCPKLPCSAFVWIKNTLFFLSELTPFCHFFSFLCLFFSFLFSSLLFSSLLFSSLLFSSLLLFFMTLLSQYSLHLYDFKVVPLYLCMS
jgi:hypothetical protein